MQLISGPKCHVAYIWFQLLLVAAPGHGRQSYTKYETCIDAVIELVSISKLSTFYDKLNITNIVAVSKYLAL